MSLKLTQLGSSVLVTLAALAAFTSAHADNQDPYYTIGSVQTHEIPNTETETTLSTRIETPPGQSDVVVGDVDITDIVNLGKQIWNIVEANAPVANVSTTTANALPKGITDWQQLTGWQTPVTKTYETVFNNLFGMTVIDFQYRVSFIPGGTYNGVGKYLANVTVAPQYVSVLWGYKFNASAAVPTLTNAGTADAPLAAADVNVQWTIDTVLKHIQQSAEYYLRADGQFAAL